MKKYVWAGVAPAFATSITSCEPEPCSNTINTIHGPMTVEIDCNPHSTY